MADWIGVISPRLSTARPGRKGTVRREDSPAPPIVVVDDLAHEPAFRLGELEVRPATREVIVGDRREVLEPRVMQVLVVLAYSAGEVVSRDDLIRTCWAGRIVGDDAISRAVAGVRRVGQRLGGFKVATVARVGYRLEAAAPAQPRAGWGSALRESLLPLLAGVAVLVGDGVSPWRVREPPPPAATEAGLALRPLRTLTPQPQVGQLAEGVRDSVVAALPTTRIRVLAPGEAAASAATPLLFGGAVSAQGGTLRVSARLDDGRSHATIWSRDFEGSAADPAVLQARVATRVAYAAGCAREALEGPHGTSEPGLLRRWMHACDLFADWKINGGPDMRDGFEWIQTLRSLTALEPDFLPAHSELAVGAAYVSRSAPPEQAAAMRRESEIHARRALALDPNASAPWIARQLELPTIRWAEREQALRKGLTAEASALDAGPWLGLLLADTGRLKEALFFLERASASNAVDVAWGGTGAWAACFARPSAEAVQRAARVQALMPESVTAWKINYGCRLYAGQWAAARAAYHAPPGPTGVASFDAMLDADFAAAQSRAPADLARARRLAVSLGEQSQEARMDAIAVLASLGFVDDAFQLAARIDPEWVEPVTVSYLFTPLTASMRRKPLFMALAQRLGLVDYWRTSGHWPDFCAEPSLPYDCKAEAARLAPWAKVAAR